MPLPSWIKLSTGTPSRADLQAAATPLEDTLATVAAENAPLRVIYGRAAVGAQIANVLVYGGKLIVQAVWCEGEIDSIQSITLNNEALPAGTSATHYTGAAGQTVNATLAAAFASRGRVYADALPGIAYSVFSIPSAASAGFPQLAAVIKGRKLLDPRTGASAWSDNPALALADFIASPVYGLGLAVDAASVAAAANDNDALVGGQPRRRIGLVIDSVKPTRQHIEALRAYAGCWVIDSGAGLKLVSDRPRAVDHTIGAADIKAGSFRLRQLGVADLPTVVHITWTDTTTTPWSEKTATARASGVATGATPRRESVVPLPGVQRYAQALREATERLNHFALENIEADWEAFDDALALEKGDVVSVSHPIGLAGKLMRVLDVAPAGPGRFAIKAREYDPAAYSDLIASEPSSADTSLPNPAAPPIPTGLAAVEEVYQVENGTFASRIRATWDAADYPYLAHCRVEIRDGANLIQAGSAPGTEWASPALQEGVTYTVRIAAVSSIGAASDWVSATVTALGKYLVPGDVPSLSTFEVGGTVYVSWPAAVDIDIWRYEVRYGSTGGSWDSAALIDRVDALRLTSSEIPAGTWRFYVKALDSVGQYSAAAATSDVTVTLDANAFFVDAFEQTSPTLSNMAAYTLAPGDPHTYYVTEDGAAFGSKFPNPLGTYSSPLATYHASIASTWLGEADDFGQVLSGQWAGTATVEALTGTLASYLGLSNDGSAWSYGAGLSHKDSGRFARLKHEALTTSTMRVTAPTQRIRLDAIPREEVGSGTSSASGATTITLDHAYAAVKTLTITPAGAGVARIGVYDNMVLGSPSSFDVYIFDAAGNKVASGFYYSFKGV